MDLSFVPLTGFLWATFMTYFVIIEGAFFLWKVLQVAADE